MAPKRSNKSSACDSSTFQRSKWPQTQKDAFLQAIEYLGGIDNARPKQILERMQLEYGVGSHEIIKDDIARRLKRLRKNVRKREGQEMRTADRIPVPLMNDPEFIRSTRTETTLPNTDLDIQASERHETYDAQENVADALPSLREVRVLGVTGSETALTIRLERHETTEAKDTETDEQILMPVDEDVDLSAFDSERTISDDLDVTSADFEPIKLKHHAETIHFEVPSPGSASSRTD